MAGADGTGKPQESDQDHDGAAEAGEESLESAELGDKDAGGMRSQTDPAEPDRFKPS